MGGIDVILLYSLYTVFVYVLLGCTLCVSFCPSAASPLFRAVLPSGIVEEVFLSLRHMAELQAIYQSLRGAQGGELSPCSSMDAELVAAACIAVMGSPTYFRSVHTRCDG